MKQIQLRRTATAGGQFGTGKLISAIPVSKKIITAGGTVRKAKYSLIRTV